MRWRPTATRRPVGPSRDGIGLLTPACCSVKNADINLTPTVASGGDEFEERAFDLRRRLLRQVKQRHQRFERPLLRSHASSHDLTRSVPPLAAAIGTNRVTQAPCLRTPESRESPRAGPITSGAEAAAYLCSAAGVCRLTERPCGMRIGRMRSRAAGLALTIQIVARESPAPAMPE
jgi:hypothetical protein